MERDGGTEVTESLKPTHKSKTLLAIKAPRAVKLITFDIREAGPGDTYTLHTYTLFNLEFRVAKDKLVSSSYKYDSKYC